MLPIASACGTTQVSFEMLYSLLKVPRITQIVVIVTKTIKTKITVQSVFSVNIGF